MVSTPSDEFLHLTATLLLSPPSPSETLNDTLLLQLQAIFGPMLMSALQLVDRREVVKVSLPTGRTVYQVMSSTGSPYTLHIALPDVAEAHAKPVVERADEHLTCPTGHPSDPPDPPEPSPSRSPPTDTTLRYRQIAEQVRCLRGLCCPCAGFAYNSLGGETSIFCKHILAVLLAHGTRKEITTHVPMPGVVGLLGIS